MIDDPRVYSGYREYWNQDQKHYLKQSPVLQAKGGQLAKNAYDYVQRGLEAAKQEVSGMSVMGAHAKIVQLESLPGVKPILEDLAREIVADSFGIDLATCEKDYNLSKEDLFDFKIQQPDTTLYQVRGAVNESKMHPDPTLFKRSMHLMVAQGMAMHNFFESLYKPLADGVIVADKIKQISVNVGGKQKNIGGELLKLYKLLAYGSADMYWSSNMEATMRSHGQQGVQGASTHRRYRDPFDEPDYSSFESVQKFGGMIFEDETDEEESLIYGFAGEVVIAQGANFIILVQEGIKAMAELCFSFGSGAMDQSEEERLKGITNRNIWDEIPYIQVGHELWRTLLKVRPDVDIRNYITLLGYLSPEDLHRLTGLVLNGLIEEAKKLLYDFAVKEGFIIPAQQQTDDSPYEYSFDEPQDEDGLPEEGQDEETDDSDWWKN